MAHQKKLAEYDRKEKGQEEVKDSVGNKLSFGANLVQFKAPPPSKGG
eukprot:CAMPEP_0176382352 /NCGR_PEP_ID=MMETSP0126-20121128/32625_1 /TAXON_ID=141414 ORGANISM="Strombidinopsis acuminatum, Strain SPMC142" /NCGR_SAMPLE_ID=MMETSP0126 /ASSEMBLY_ACC=CAM_ASM_000229 /LENGTH=46 /DNA_ID= /DNA_START= /DNA_END= /DNA_ORIENTATION=